MRLDPLLWVALLAGPSCAGPLRSQRTTADVERAEVLPVGYVALGTARASCAPAPAWGRLAAEPLTRFDCSQVTLERALAEQAATRGGSLLAGMRCRRAGDGLACAATIAGAEEGTASLADGARREPSPSDALAFETARTIAVDLEPTTASFARRARGADEVGTQSRVPVSHRSLGSLTAHCSRNDCDSDDLRLALRVAAGALGVSDVAEVACRVGQDDAFCVATLAAAELDPESDPRGR